MNKERLSRLITQYQKNLEFYRNAREFNEQDCRDEFISPLLESFGWDVHNEKGTSPQYKEVVVEKFSNSGDRPDYTLTLNGVSKIFVEAKKPAVNIKEESEPAIQARRYGWNAKHKLSILTNFEDMMIYDVNERAICNLMPSIKKSKADISFIIGIRNNVSTYQALKCLINMKVSVFVFDTARIESIFHAKVIVGSGTNSAKVICGSANITTGGLANNIEAGIISKLNLRCESDEKFLTEVREYIDNIIHNYPQNVKKISEDRELDELYEQGLVVDENQRKLRNNFFCASKEKQEKSIVSRFPLVNKKLLNFGKKQKQTNAILRKLDQVIVEEVCEEVWKSNKLTKSHLGIVKKGTHANKQRTIV